VTTVDSDAIYRYYESAGYAQVELDNGVVFWYRKERQ